jgi:hypothetical protein
LAFALLLLGSSAHLSAHRRDEYLQAARLAVDPTAVQLELALTPGIAVADAVFNEADRNGDGVLAAAEQRASAAHVLAAINMSVDGVPVRMRPMGLNFPEREELTRGEGTIHLRYTAAMPRLIEGEHHLVFQNRYRGDIAVYLANALVPDSDRITVVAQRRDPAQRDLTIDFVVRGSPSSSRLIWPTAAIAVVVGLLMIVWGQTRDNSRRLGSDPRQLDPRQLADAR